MTMEAANLSYIDNRPLTSDEIENEDVVWGYKNGVCIGARLVLHKEFSPDGKTELTNESGGRQYAAALLRGGYQFYRRKVSGHNGQR